MDAGVVVVAGAFDAAGGMFTCLQDPGGVKLLYCTVGYRLLQATEIRCSGTVVVLVSVAAVGFEGFPGTNLQDPRA